MSTPTTDSRPHGAPAPALNRAARRQRHRLAHRLAAGAVVFTATALAATPAYAVPPTPVAAQPPGTDGLNTMLGWGSWVMSFACVLGIIIVAAIMAIKHRRGGGEESMGALGWVLGACVLGTASGPIANALIV